jgi:hypothetical protein
MQLLNPQGVAGLLLEAAARNASIVAVDEKPGPSWTVEFDTCAQCLVEIAPGGRSLVATADAGCPGGERRPAIERRALGFNLLWKQTSGMRLACDPPSGRIFLLQEFPASSLRENAFEELLFEFAAMHAYWTLLVRTADQPGA